MKKLLIPTFLTLGLGACNGVDTDSLSNFFDQVVGGVDQARSEVFNANVAALETYCKTPSSVREGLRDRYNNAVVVNCENIPAKK